MKKKNVLAIILIIVFNSSIQSQILTIEGYFQGEKKDEVTLGLTNNASQSIDLSLGEQNIILDSLNDFEIRILQREENNFKCLYELNSSTHDNPIYFETSFDSKINFRNLLEPNNIYFEVENSTKNFESFVFSSGSIPLNDVILRVWTYSSECNLSTLLVADFSNISNPIDNFQYLMGPTQSLDQFIDRFIIEFDSSFVSSISTNPIKKDLFKVFPNPASEYFTVERNSFQGKKILIDLYDFNGQLINQVTQDERVKNIDISNLSKGIYLLKIVEIENNNVHHYKLVKE